MFNPHKRCAESIAEPRNAGAAKLHAVPSYFLSSNSSHFNEETQAFCHTCLEKSLTYRICLNKIPKKLLRMDSTPTWNKNSPAVKRLMRELAELRQAPSADFHIEPLEDNLFEWHFTLRGPTDSPYEGGYYHGRMIIPEEYPMKPPSFVFLTPSGRFEVGKKICLSISNYHPEHWRPAWGIRTAMVALVSIMPEEDQGSIGAMNCSDDIRRAYARESSHFVCPQCGAVKRDWSVASSASDSSAAPSGDDSVSSRPLVDPVDRPALEEPEPVVEVVSSLNDTVEAGQSAPGGESMDDHAPAVPSETTATSVQRDSPTKTERVESYIRYVGCAWLLLLLARLYVY